MEPYCKVLEPFFILFLFFTENTTYIIILLWDALRCELVCSGRLILYWPRCGRHDWIRLRCWEAWGRWLQKRCLILNGLKWFEAELQELWWFEVIKVRILIFQVSLQMLITPIRSIGIHKIVDLQHSVGFRIKILHPYELTCANSMSPKIHWLSI